MSTLRDSASDLAFAGRHYMTMVRDRRWEKILGDRLERWERASPRTFNAVQSVLGGRGDEDVAATQPPLPAYGSTVTVDGITMRVDERMSGHNIRKLMKGRHTRHERDLLDTVLRPDDRLMELGGGIGMVAIHSSKALGSENVYSFEANPGLESLIRDNYALNDVSPTLTIAMLGKEEGTRTFYVGERFSRGSIHADEGDRAVEVPVLPFQEAFDRIAPSVLVMDIQGGEGELMTYADLSPLRVLLIEIHPDIIGIGAANRIRQAIRTSGMTQTGRAGQSFLFVRPG